VRFERFSFGEIRIDGKTCDCDIVIDRGRVFRRDKKASKKYRDAFGHTPISTEENIPWKCRRLVIGTGGGALPVMDEVLLRCFAQPGFEHSFRFRAVREDGNSFTAELPRKPIRSGNIDGSSVRAQIRRLEDGVVHVLMESPTLT